MSDVWNTKYGTRRVRFDPPTLKEAIFAARGLTGELHQQAEIAASLMELPVEEVRAELLKTEPPRHGVQIVTNGRDGTARTVIVEHKPSRRPAVTGAVRSGSAKRLDPPRHLIVKAAEKPLEGCS